MNYTCPICGYPGLGSPPYSLDTKEPSFDICPCCGGEYGYDDFTEKARQKYIIEWIRNGAKWLEPEMMPYSWDLRAQLSGIGIDLDKLIEESSDT